MTTGWWAGAGRPAHHLVLIADRLGGNLATTRKGQHMADNGQRGDR